MAPAVHLRCQQPSIIPYPASMAVLWTCRPGIICQRQSRGSALGCSLISSSASAAASIRLSKGASLPEAWNLHRPQLQSAVAAIGSCDWQWLPMSTAQLSSAGLHNKAPPPPKSGTRRQRQAVPIMHTEHQAHDKSRSGHCWFTRYLEQFCVASHDLRVRRTSKSEIQLGMCT